MSACHSSRVAASATLRLPRIRGRRHLRSCTDATHSRQLNAPAPPIDPGSPCLAALLRRLPSLLECGAAGCRGVASGYWAHWLVDQYHHTGVSTQSLDAIHTIFEPRSALKTLLKGSSKQCSCSKSSCSIGLQDDRRTGTWLLGIRLHEQQLLSSAESTATAPTARRSAITFPTVAAAGGVYTSCTPPVVYRF